MKVNQITTTNPHYQTALTIRDVVLRKPLGLKIQDEDLSDEQNHIHFVALKGQEIVGTVTLVPHIKPGEGKLRQMATIEGVRGQGFGKLLVRELEAFAQVNQMSSIQLHARQYAVAFYKKLGYQVTSAPFTEVGIPHVIMQKDLA